MVESKETNPPKWQIFFLSLYIFMFDSRLIQCFLNVFMNVFAVVIIFFGEKRTDMVFGLYTFIVLFSVVGVVMAVCHSVAA
jgi:lipopolysaccharide export LptBFGC system permease protein LptF